MSTENVIFGDVLKVFIQGHEYPVQMRCVQLSGYCAGGGIALIPEAIAKDVVESLNSVGFNKHHLSNN